MDKRYSREDEQSPSENPPPGRRPVYLPRRAVRTGTRPDDQTPSTSYEPPARLVECSADSTFEESIELSTGTRPANRGSSTSYIPPAGSIDCSAENQQTGLRITVPSAEIFQTSGPANSEPYESRILQPTRDQIDPTYCNIARLDVFEKLTSYDREAQQLDDLFPQCPSYELFKQQRKDPGPSLKGDGDQSRPTPPRSPILDRPLFGIHLPTIERPANYDDLRNPEMHYWDEVLPRRDFNLFGKVFRPTYPSMRGLTQPLCERKFSKFQPLKRTPATLNSRHYSTTRPAAAQKQLLTPNNIQSPNIPPHAQFGRVQCGQRVPTTPPALIDQSNRQYVPVNYKQRGTFVNFQPTIPQRQVQNSRLWLGPYTGTNFQIHPSYPRYPLPQVVTNNPQFPHFQPNSQFSSYPPILPEPGPSSGSNNSSNISLNPSNIRLPLPPGCYPPSIANFNPDSRYLRYPAIRSQPGPSTNVLSNYQYPGVRTDAPMLPQIMKPFPNNLRSIANSQANKDANTGKSNPPAGSSSVRGNCSRGRSTTRRGSRNKNTGRRGKFKK